MSGKTKKGFNMLTIGWTDGYSFVPLGFNMLASAAKKNRIVEAAECDKRSNAYKKRQEAVMQKPSAFMGTGGRLKLFSGHASRSSALEMNTRVLVMTSR